MPPYKLKNELVMRALYLSKQGLSNTIIAQRLGISNSRVAMLVRRHKEKLSEGYTIDLNKINEEWKKVKVLKEK